MAVELTPDERSRVENSRVAPKPQFFNAATGNQQDISEDFESFIILQDKGVLQETIDWIKKSSEIMEGRVSRNAVAFEALVADQDDLSTRKSEIDDLAQAFNDWKASSFLSGKFSEVSEVGLIIADLQAVAEEVFVFQERMKHLENVQFRVTGKLGQDVTTAQLQELSSWPTPLLSY